MVKIRNKMGDEWHGKQRNAVYETKRSKGFIKRRLLRKKNANTKEQQGTRSAFVQAKTDYPLWKNKYKHEMELCIKNNHERDLNGFPLTVQLYTTKIYTTKIQAEKEQKTDPPDWHNIAYSKRLQVKIQERSGRDVRNHAALIVIPAGHDLLKNYDSRQIRVYAAGSRQEIPYYIEHIGTDTDNGRIWIKPPVLSASSETVFFIYYAPFDAAAPFCSNPYSVFSYFHDFESGTAGNIELYASGLGAKAEINTTAAIEGAYGMNIKGARLMGSAYAREHSETLLNSEKTLIFLRKALNSSRGSFSDFKAWDKNKRVLETAWNSDGKNKIKFKEGTQTIQADNEGGIRQYIAISATRKEATVRLEEPDKLNIQEIHGGTVEDTNSDNVAWQDEIEQSNSTEDYLDNIAATTYAQLEPDTQASAEYEELKDIFTELRIKHPFIEGYEYEDDTGSEGIDFYPEFIQGKIPTALTLHLHGAYNVTVYTPYYHYEERHRS